MALAHPDVHVVALRDSLHVGTKKLVWTEQNWNISRNRLHDFNSVGTCAANICFGFHRSSGVYIADNNGARVLCLPCTQLVCSDGVGQRTSSTLIGNDDCLVVRKNLCGLCHEVNTAEHDGRLWNCCCNARQRKRVAYMMCNILDLRYLIVMRKDHSIFFGCKSTDAVSPFFVDGGSHANKVRRGISKLRLCEKTHFH